LRTLIDTGTIATSHLLAISSAISFAARAWSATVAQRGYLSGASGVGKSSLLSAAVLPQLHDAGWTVVETRLFGDPAERLRKAALEDERIFKRKPTNANELSLRELLKIAAEATAKTHATPLLLVIDQFEEFLILHDEKRTAVLAVEKGGLGTGDRCH
jgi:hypothetical protein